MWFEIHVEYVNVANEQYNTEKIINSQLTTLAEYSIKYQNLKTTKNKH